MCISLLKAQYATILRAKGSIPYQVIRFFNIINVSGRTMALGSTQLLTQILLSTRNVPESGRKGGRCLRLASRPLKADFLENVGVSTSHNRLGIHGLLQRELYLFHCSKHSLL
jgi:hypothetical protein